MQILSQTTRRSVENHSAPRDRQKASAFDVNQQPIGDGMSSQIDSKPENHRCTASDRLQCQSPWKTTIFLWKTQEQLVQYAIHQPRLYVQISLDLRETTTHKIQEIENDSRNASSLLLFDAACNKGAGSQRMLGVRVRVVTMLMGVIPLGVRVMGQSQRDRHTIGLASSGAFTLTEIATIAQALHMVVVAGLSQTNLCLKAQHLCSVLTERTVHSCLAA